MQSENESLSEDQRYTLAYSACMGNPDKTFLHYLIFDCNLKEDLINPKYITEETKSLFAQRNAEQLEKELGMNDSKDKKVKV